MICFCTRLIRSTVVTRSKSDFFSSLDGEKPLLKRLQKHSTDVERIRLLFIFLLAFFACERASVVCSQLAEEID